VETKSGENHGIIFIICLEELHSLEEPTSFVFQLQLEGGSNQKEATTPYVLRLQPEGGYNHLSFPLPDTLK
jgi:hypothetical protein